MKRGVFLDRDGTLNELVDHGPGLPNSPFTLKEFKIKPHAVMAVRMMQRLGYYTFIVTNQPFVVDGPMSKRALQEIMDYCEKMFDIDDWLAAIYRNTDYYKPGTRMFIDLAKRHELSLPDSWMIGDMWRDVVAGKRAGCRAIFLGDIYCPPKEWDQFRPDYICPNVLDACTKIIDVDILKGSDDGL